MTNPSDTRRPHLEYFNYQFLSHLPSQFPSLIQAAPASSFGGALFVKPLASSISGSPTSDAASTATLPSLSRAGTPGGHATPSPSRVNLAAAPGWLSLGSAHRPGSALTAKYDTLEEAIAFARAQGGGDPGSQGGDGEEEGGDGNDSKDGDGSGSGSKEAQKKEVGVDLYQEVDIMLLCTRYIVYSKRW